MAERVSPSAGFLERVDERRCRLRTGAHSLAVIACWVLMLDVDFEIETPAELRDHARALHARLGRTLERKDGARRRRQ
jgi:hypothetical protein